LENNNTLSARIKNLLAYLNQNLYGKEEAVRLALLSAIANESIFFMGPPGTAKSMISRRIAAAFKDFYEDGKFTTENGGYFEYLMNEFSTPDEICGPVDLSALNEKPSRYERQTEGYLPSAKVAFLDEIWKSGPAILNTLLTIINEKKFHNGKKVEKVPLVSLASASNELPEKNRGLEALWDRFILRVFVNPVSDENNFFNVVDDPDDKKTKEEKEIEQKELYSKIEPYLLNFDDVKAWQDEINKIELSEEAKAVISGIRKELALLNNDENHKGDEAWYVSDRRWKKIVHILKTSAFLNGRDSVDLMDCSLIEYAIWNTDKQHDEACGIVEKILKQNGLSSSSAIDDISDQIDDFKNAVDEKWFDEIVQSPEPEQYKMKDGTLAYKIINPEKIRSYDYITPFYVSKDYKHQRYNNRKGAYYDKDKDLIGDYDYFFQEESFKIENNTVKFVDGYRGETYSFEIEMQKTVPPSKYELKLFEPVAKKTLKEYFDKEKYTPIVEQIDSKIVTLQNFRADNEKPFSENAFANASRYSPILLSKIDESIKTLEDKKLKLKEQHERYASDSNVKSDFELGDIILKTEHIKNLMKMLMAKIFLQKFA
jgi:MoxR-like ATPase